MPYLSESTYVKALMQYLPSSKCSIVGYFSPPPFFFWSSLPFCSPIRRQSGVPRPGFEVGEKIFCVDTGSLILDYMDFC